MGYQHGPLHPGDSLIEQQIEAIEKKAEEKAVNVELRAEFMGKFEGNLKGPPDWIKYDHPQTVNRLLAAMCAHIIIQPDCAVEIVWRDPSLGISL